MTNERDLLEFVRAADAVAEALNDPGTTNAEATRVLNIYYRVRDKVLRAKEQVR